MTELLSPAGGFSALVAAVQNGADAVYMGFGAFNARRSARNFSDAEFRAAVSYCHLRGVRVYLTLNTLLTDRELPALAETAKRASDYGVDAILVQDLGVLETLKAVVPDVPLHASTQMSVHTLSGVKEAAALGMERAVLARELSRGDIAEICEHSPIEIEVFAHGALCMCYSGQCEMSAVIGGRSGNRGACAQPCRLPYGWNGKADGYPLSLKDASLADHIPQLQELGVACIKLEGRMKRPEYVAAVTRIYARLLREHRKATADEQRELEEAFSRDGFTQGYFLGRRGRQMFGTRAENARWPEEWFAELRRSYEKEDLRLVGVRFDAAIKAGVPMTLTAEDACGNRACVLGAVPETARSRAVTAQEVADRLRKTGGTAFTVTGCTVTLDDGLAVSAAALNALRRDALERLTALRCAVPERCAFDYVPPQRIGNPTQPPRFTVSLSRADQLTDALVSLRPAMICLPLELIESMDLAPYLTRTEFVAVLPRIYRTSEERALRALLSSAKEKGVSGVTVGNLGHFALADGLDLTVHGDYSLNIYNSAALRLLSARGLSSACVSFELRSGQIRDLSKALPCEAIVYGRLPLMITENCIVANEYGCRYANAPCKTAQKDSACAAAPALTDRRGERFPVLRVWGCRSELQNAKTLWLADRDEYRRIGLSYARLRFTTETAGECVRVFKAYLGQDDFVPAGITRGLFSRGVE